MLPGRMTWSSVQALHTVVRSSTVSTLGRVLVNNVISSLLQDLFLYIVIGPSSLWRQKEIASSQDHFGAVVNHRLNRSFEPYTLEEGPRSPTSTACHKHRMPTRVNWLNGQKRGMGHRRVPPRSRTGVIVEWTSPSAEHTSTAALIVDADNHSKTTQKK